MVGLGRVAKMLFNIVGDVESFKNVKCDTLPVFAEAILSVAQKKLRDRFVSCFFRAYSKFRD